MAAPTAPSTTQTEQDALKDPTSDPPPPYSPGNYEAFAMTNPAGGPPHPLAPAPGPPESTYPGQAPVLITQAPAVVPGTIQYGFGETPASIVCPYCGRSIISMVRYETGAMTWAIFACLMLCLCWLCAWIPFIANGTKDVIHSCPSCGTTLGVYRRL